MADADPFAADTAADAGSAALVFYLWPCHVEIFELWQHMQTRWSRDVNGQAQLDYAGVETVLRRRGGLRGAALDQAFCQVQALEAGALAGMQQAAKGRKPQH